MHSARSQESPLSQDQTIFGRHAGRLLGLVALVGALALGTLPVSAQAVVPETPPLPAVTALGPRELVKSSLSRVLTIIESQSAKATEAGRRRAEIRQAADEMFDFDDMSRRILAQHWKDRSRRGRKNSFDSSRISWSESISRPSSPTLWRRSPSRTSPSTAPTRRYNPA